MKECLLRAAKFSLLFLSILTCCLGEETALKNLDFLFYQKMDDSLSVEYKQQLGEYNGFYLEGENLENLCKSDQNKTQIVEFNEDTLLSFASTLQYHALDLTTKALGRYAFLLGLAESEYEEFSENLVNGYCSKNLTIFSHKKLKKDLKNAFNSDYKLPDIIQSPYFNPLAKKMIYQSASTRKEFYYTTEIFKAFCSWGHDPYQLGLISDFLRSPALMAYSAREVSGLKVKWNLSSRKVSLVQDYGGTKRVLCKNLFCRTSTAKDFLNYFAQINGSTQVRDTAARLYCSKLRTQDFGQAFYKMPQNEIADSKVPIKIAKIGQTLTDLDRRLMVSQLTALVTNVPDFILRLSEKEKIKNLLSSDLDDRWQNWATQSLERAAGNILYEEPLVIEKISRAKYFDNTISKFNVEFDVNLGELDRSIEQKGKISTEFSLKVAKNLLRFIRMKKRTYDIDLKTDLSNLDTILIGHIKNDLRYYNEKFVNPLWNDRLANLIADELILQVDAYSGDFFAEVSNEVVKIPIRLNFGPYALKYIFHKNQVRENQEEDKLLSASKQ